MRIHSTILTNILHVIFQQGDEDALYAVRKQNAVHLNEINHIILQADGIAD